MRFSPDASPNRNSSQSRPFHPSVQRPPTVVATLDRNLRYVSVTEAIEAHIGLRPADLIGHTNRELGLPVALALLLDSALESVFTSAQPQEIEMLFPTQKGSCCFHCQILPGIDVEGGQETVLLSAWDIPQEPAARVIEPGPGELLDRAQGAIVQMDLHGQLLYRNAAANRLFGWSESAALNPFLAELFAPCRETFERALREVAENGTWSGTLRVKTAEESTLGVHSRWTLVAGGQGEAPSILLFNSAITPEQIRARRDARVQREVSLSRFAEGVGDGLAQALAPLQSALEALRNHLHQADDLEALDRIEAGKASAQALIGQIRSLVQSSQVRSQEFSPLPVLRDLEGIVRQSFPRNIAFQVYASGDLWPMQGDPAQLREALLQLCVNSREAMPEGGALTLRAANLYVDPARAEQAGLQAGPHLLLEISDTGTGIPPEIVGQIFDPYFTTHRSESGRGLGLTRVQAIVKGHNGMVTIPSHPQSGAVFRILLPALGGRAL